MQHSIFLSFGAFIDILLIIVVDVNYFVVADIGFVCVAVNVVFEYVVIVLCYCIMLLYCILYMLL